MIRNDPNTVRAMTNFELVVYGLRFQALDLTLCLPLVLLALVWRYIILDFLAVHIVSSGECNFPTR